MVSVYFFSSEKEQHGVDKPVKILESATIVKLKPIQLVVHFGLVCNLMQKVFDILHDLENVETLYKDHIARSKRASEGLNKTANEKLKRLTTIRKQ